MERGGVRLFVASPTFTGDFCSEYVESLVLTLKDLQSHGVLSAYKALPGIHWIDIARDILAHLFLASDCTHMIQIDADLGWDCTAPRRMIELDVDVVGGAYPIKTDVVEHYPITPKGLPGGFMLVKRHVIAELSAPLPKYSVCVMGYGELRVAPLYTRIMRPESYTGEDFAFCQRVGEAGYEIGVLKDIDFSHVGRKAWRGNYLQHTEGGK